MKLDWINTSKSGDSFEYHRGDLAYDARKGGGSPDLARLRDAFWAAYEAGLVSLVQRRNGVSDFSYIAQRR